MTCNASTGAASYNVYRGKITGAERKTPIATVVTATSLTNTGLTNGTKYFYRVAAVNASGTSGLSNEASATPLAPKPTAVNATAQVRITKTAVTYSPTTHSYSGTVTIRSLSSTAVAGPLELVFSSLTAGVTVAGASGGSANGPYLTLTGLNLLAAATHTTVSIRLVVPSPMQITYMPLRCSATF